MPTESRIGCLLIFATCAAGLGCGSPSATDRPSLAALVAETPSIPGRTGYLASPYVAAGDRVYMVGHQDGRFPDLGWHVKGEMGGIWNHPVKLMDGFVVAIADSSSGTTECLNSAMRFVNYPLANKHVYELDDLQVRRFQFVPDGVEGLVVEYSIENRSQDERKIRFTFTGLVDLTPVWLSERVGVEDGSDTALWQEDDNAIVAKDQMNDWFVVLGSSLEAVRQEIGTNPCPSPRKGNGVDATLTYELTVAPGGTAVLPFFVAGSYTGREAALKSYRTLKRDARRLLGQKIERYADIKSTAGISIPDKKLEEAYTWIKYNTDWLVRDVPGIGRGLSAGIPDYPWWFGADNSYALQGALATGRVDIAESTMQMLHQLSKERNGNGRIVHEVSTNGVVFNPGNLNETPHFAMLVWTAYEWTGDRDILVAYYPTVKKGLDWMMAEQDEDRNGYPDGAGMMEIHGLDSEMIDVVAYTQQAFEAAAKMAAVMNEPDVSMEFERAAESLRKRINAEWWVEEASSFADFRATTSETLHLIDDAIVRADTLDKPWSVGELRDLRQQVASYPPGEKRGHVLHHNWVVNVPMEVGVADRDKAIRALDTGRRYVNPFGVYVTGIDRQEVDDVDSLGSPKWKTFSYVGAVMTLPTGVQAISEARYGRPDRAYEYLKMLINSFSYALPGSMYEVSPDYGMIAQAWNVYAVAVPIVQYFFGVQPRAYDQHVVLRPRMPESWDDAELRRLPVGENVIDFSKETVDDTIVYYISQDMPEWTVELRLPSAGGLVVHVNGKPFDPDVIHDDLVIPLSGSSNEVRLRIP